MGDEHEFQHRALIAEFEYGFAKGWYFAVSEEFRPQLDIRPLPGTPGGARKWMQGPLYCFTAGQILYDAPNGYLGSCESLKHFGMMVEITAATPNRLDDSGCPVEGRVRFSVSTPAEDRSGPVLLGEFSATQNEFVEFLKTGRMGGKTFFEP